MADRRLAGSPPGERLCATRTEPTPRPGVHCERPEPGEPVMPLAVALPVAPSRTAPRTRKANVAAGLASIAVALGLVPLVGAARAGDDPIPGAGRSPIE